MDHTHQEKSSAIAAGGGAVTTCVLHPAGKALGLHLEAHCLLRQCGAQKTMNSLMTSSVSSISVCKPQ